MKDYSFRMKLKHEIGSIVAALPNRKDLVVFDG
jgi:hypothetical protein